MKTHLFVGTARQWRRNQMRARCGEKRLWYIARTVPAVSCRRCLRGIRVVEPTSNTKETP